MKKLKLFQRIMLFNLLPKEGSIKSMIVTKDLRKKLGLTQKELKDYKIESTPEGNITCNAKGVEKVFSIDFTDMEVMEVKLALKQASDQKKINELGLELCEIFEVTE